VAAASVVAEAASAAVADAAVAGTVSH
jgi:hypothetical protein